MSKSTSQKPLENVVHISIADLVKHNCKLTGLADQLRFIQLFVDEELAGDRDPLGERPMNGLSLIFDRVIKDIDESAFDLCAFPEEDNAR